MRNKGINPINLLKCDKGKYQSGQMGQTVNLLAYAFGGSNPSLPTQLTCGSSSVDRALAFQAEGRGFESRLPLSRKSDNQRKNLRGLLGSVEI